MKRKIISVFTIFVVLVCFLGCSNPSNSTGHYKIEMGVITYSTSATVVNRISNSDTLSYLEIKKIRNYLLTNTISNHNLITSVSIDEIKGIMLAHGISSCKVESTIKNVNEYGISIGIFEHYENDKIIWTYITQ